MANNVLNQLNAMEDKFSQPPQEKSLKKTTSRNKQIKPRQSLMDSQLEISGNSLSVQNKNLPGAFVKKAQNFEKLKQEKSQYKSAINAVQQQRQQELEQKKL